MTPNRFEKQGGTLNDWSGPDGHGADARIVEHVANQSPLPTLPELDNRGLLPTNLTRPLVPPLASEGPFGL